MGCTAVRGVVLQPIGGCILNVHHINWWQKPSLLLGCNGC